MKAIESGNNLFLVINLRGLLFGLPGSQVVEMLAMPPLTKVPRLPDHMRGVVNLRGRVMPLMDLRERLGLGSSLKGTEGIIRKLESLEKDHARWADEVMAVAAGERDFSGEMDPEKCSFGQWFGGFSAKRSLYLANAVGRFQAPHLRMHQRAGEALELAARGEKAGAVKAAAPLKEDMAEMAKVFQEVRTLILETGREIAVVMSNAGQYLALAVDAVVAVETLRPKDQSNLAGLGGDVDREMLGGIAQRVREDSLVMILQTAGFFSESEVVDLGGAG